MHVDSEIKYIFIVCLLWYSSDRRVFSVTPGTTRDRIPVHR